MAPVSDNGHDVSAKLPHLIAEKVISASWRDHAIDWLPCSHRVYREAASEKQGYPVDRYDPPECPGPSSGTTTDANSMVNAS